jgi:hypothetical protein
MAKYIPPHSRAAPAPAPAAEPAPAAADGSMSNWLREARQGYVPKTPEQIRQESLCMNYTQLRSRAGPPPTISSDEYGGPHEQGGEGVGARVCGSFDEGLRLYKLGRGGPPEPLSFDGRDDGNVVSDGIAPAVYMGLSKAQQLRRAYASWYAQWGQRLNYLWRAEHPELCAPTKKKLPPTTPRRIEEKKEPSRGYLVALATEVGEKSGW